MNSFKATGTPIRRRQVDRLLASIQGVRRLDPPRKGWISEVRGLLGMRTNQLARRMGVSPSAVPQFERSEADGSITLNTLKKAATALDCRLVYAFVPNHASFDEAVRAQAEVVANALIRGVDHTMALEDQSTTSESQKEIVSDLVDDLVRRLPRDLWDAPP